jgi:hypothetical protein
MVLLHLCPLSCMCLYAPVVPISVEGNRVFLLGTLHYSLPIEFEWHYVQLSCFGQRVHKEQNARMHFHVW